VPIKHLLLAILVAALWGTNFVFIKMGLQGVSPFLLCALRFLLSALPFVFFIPRPEISKRLLLAYGLCYFTLHFGLLFTGMRLGVTAGLASLVLQTQVFFTIGLSFWFLKERSSSWKLAGAFLAFLGIALVSFHTDAELSFFGIVFILMAAVSFASGNLVSKKLGAVDPLALVVWGNLVAFLPMLLICLLWDGWTSVSNTLVNLSPQSMISLFYIVYLSTLLGFSLWSFLLSRYPAASVAPFTLLVPIFGFLGSRLILDEPLFLWKIEAAILVIGGLAINIFGPQIQKRLRIHKVR